MNTLLRHPIIYLLPNRSICDHLHLGNKKRARLNK
jgi:hypothetical protein